MSSSLLTLGSFSFEGLEVPGSILIKSRQRIAVHHLGSGTSVAEVLGEDCEMVAFRGVFSGLQAAARIRAVEYIRTQGLPCSLTWDSKSLSVVVQEFVLNYSSSRWISYKLSCVAVQSSTSGFLALPDPISASPDTQVGNISSLLLNTDVNPTSTQIAALVTLAMPANDGPSIASLQQASELLTPINRETDSLDARLTNVHIISSDSLSNNQEHLRFVTGNAGALASLLLARNRIMNIVVTAGGVNQ
jgi:hypothetical protein